MKAYKFIILTALIFMSAGSNAESISPDSVVNMVMLAIKPAMSTLATTAIAWLGAFATLQFVITNFGVLKSGGDIEQVYAKLIGSIAWFGICFYILTNGPEFISKVGDSFFHIIGADLPSAGDIISDALVLVGKMIVVSMVGAAIPMVGNTLGPIIVYIMIFNFAVSLLFAFKIFMVQLELGLIVMLSPLSFSFLGMNALKDQGIAPFKSLISLGYRIILMTVIMVAYSTISSVVGDEFAKFGNLSTTDFLSTSAIAGLFKSVISAFGAYLVLAYFLWKSDAIAATLAGGGTNMGTADIASAAAIGAAAGAAVATGGASAVGAAGNIGQALTDKMTGASASVNNASRQGVGNDLMKMPGGASSGGGGSGAPSAFSTNSRGAPMRPEATGAGGSDGVASTGSTGVGGAGAESAAPSGPSSKSQSPPQKSVTALLQDSQNASDGASAAGAPPQAVKAAGDAAYGSGVVGGSPQQIEDAVVSAGGTQEQGRAAAAAVESTSGGWGAPIAPPEAAKTPSTGADTSLQSPSIGTGTGTGANIVGKNFDQQASNQNSSGGNPFFGHLKEFGKHMEQDKAATHVSINTHHSD